MTLIVTSIRPADVVITADGRSTRTDGKSVVQVIDTFQKIFPVPEHPVVVAQHGENDLGDKPLGEFMSDFFRRLNAGNLGLAGIADELRAYAHPVVRDRLRQLSPGINGCGFLIAGFVVHQEEPGAVELFWTIRNDVLITEERHWEPVSIVLSGDGKKQIHVPDWHAIVDKPVQGVRKYNQSLVREAIDARIKPNTVGGHVHELVISRDSWAWSIKPERISSSAK